MQSASRVKADQNPRGAIAALALIALLSSLGAGAPNVALPVIARDFDAAFAAVQWVVVAYLLAGTALVVAVGRLADIYGRRRLLSAGVVLFTAASAACALAPDLGTLIAARAAQGLGAAAMMALAMSFVGQTVAGNKAGAVMGLIGTMSAVGAALGPSLGGALTAIYDWRAIFWLYPLPGLAALALVRRALPADAPARGPRNGEAFDAAGAFLLTVSVGAYALSMSTGLISKGAATFGLFNILAAAVAVAAAALFVVVERRAAAPLIRVTGPVDPALRAGLISTLLVATVMMATLVVGPFYLNVALGLDAAAVGAVMSAGPINSALVGLPAGRAVDRFGARPMTILGLAIAGVGAGLLAALPQSAGVAGYICAIIVTTTGYALFQAANNVAVLGRAAADRRGALSGLLNMARNLGLISGATFLGAVYAAAGLRVSFAVAAALIGAALLLTLAATSKAADSPLPAITKKA
jgi:MFS family permease